MIRIAAPALALIIGLGSAAARQAQFNRSITGVPIRVISAQAR